MLHKGRRAATINLIDPATLFTGGRKGYWLDPSDLTSLWTTDARSTNCVLTNDVGAIDDKSGNSHSMLQSNATYRPTIEQDGSGNNYMDVISLNYFVCPVISTTAGDWTFIIAANIASAGVQHIMDATTGRLIIGASALTAGSVGYYDGGYKEATYGSYGSNAVLTMLMESSTSGVIRENGSDIATGLSYTQKAVGGVTNLFTNIVMSGGHFTGDVYGMLLIDRILTTTEVEAIELYMAAKAGVTL